MKKITLIILFALSLSVFAQNDKIIVSEDSVMQIGEYDKLFNLLAADKQQINCLIKFNAVDWGQLSPSVVIEQRIFKGLTIEPSVRLDAYTITQQEGIGYMFTPSVGLKYYHNLSYREKKGRNTNGFSGNYLMVAALLPSGNNASILESRLNREYFTRHNYEAFTENTFYNTLLLNAGYGIQRRFIGLGYVDFSFGYSFNVYSNKLPLYKPMPFVKVGIGFGLTPQKFKEIIR
jgi:hypothetical protein